MSQAKRTSAALPGHRHFHVFRTRLQKWPRLFSSWSKAAKKRRLLFQALSHFCMYLSLSVCVHVYSVNATKHRWCLYENEKKKKGKVIRILVAPFQFLNFFFFPLVGLSNLRERASQSEPWRLDRFLTLRGVMLHEELLCNVNSEQRAHQTVYWRASHQAMNQGRSLDTAKKEKEKKEIAEITVIILHTQVMLSFAEQLTKKKKKKLYHWQMSASSAQHPVEVKPRYNELDDTRKVCR